MTGPPSWVGSPPGSFHGCLQPDEGGHWTACGPGCGHAPQGRTGNRRERRKKEKKCPEGDTWLLFSTLLQDVSSSLSACFLLGKFPWLALAPAQERATTGSLAPTSEPLVLAAAGRLCMVCCAGGLGNAVWPASALPMGLSRAGCTLAVRRRRRFWGLSSAFHAGQPGCPVPGSARCRPCSLPYSATPGPHLSRDYAKFS